MSRVPIAIVGIGCRFPGGINDPGSFWRVVSLGQDVVTEFPATRPGLEGLYDPRPATPGRMSTRWGGFLDRIEEFDAAFFEISPREAERLDPQQRLLLETSWEALEDAGIDTASLEGSRTGVYVGQWLSDFESLMFADQERLDLFGTTGSGRYATSGRISYAFGLRGPSLTIDTACSSSLAAIHLAGKAIENGECEMALAGGVNVILEPHITIAYSQSSMMALDGRCKFADAAGDGYVRSEGAGVVVLKALDAALADGDRIYAVIRGSAINNDGRSSGSMGTPSRLGQQDLLQAAYADAGVDPSTVGYIEAHGTGTRVGDPVEIGALAEVLAPNRAPGSRCYIGSVKTNFGHTEGAAGVAGLIKSSLALHHGQIPASLHFRTPNPLIPWNELPFEIPRGLVPWTGASSRIAGVNSFGIAGTNAHIVLEASPPATAQAGGHDGADASPILVISAKSPDALRQLAASYATLLESDAAPALQDVCWSAATRRTALEYRAAFVERDAAAMSAALRRYADGDAPAIAGQVAAGTRPRVAFVFPGQGAQWTGMARELAAKNAVFRTALERCDAAARPYADWTIVEQLQLEADDPRYVLDQIDVIQPVLVALAIAYAEVWRSLGVEPDAIVGHSMGEIGAAYAAGVLDLDQAMRIICTRSRLMRSASGKGAMALVELPMDEAVALLRGRDNVSVAVSNSARSSVISGEPGAVEDIMRELEARGVFCRRVKVDVAAHSPQMSPLATKLGDDLAGLRVRAESIPLYSSVSAERAAGAELGAGYWARNLASPVLFSATIDRMMSDGITTFIELGPHPVLLESIRETAAVRDAAVATIECARRETSELEALSRAAAALYCAGVVPPLLRMLPRGKFVPLPLYPWQRERYWSQPRSDRLMNHQEASVRVVHPWFRTGVEIAGTPRGALWDLHLDPSAHAFLSDHRLHGTAVASASVYVESALVALGALRAGGAIRDLRFERPLVIGSGEPAVLRLTALASREGDTVLEWNRREGDEWVLHSRATASNGVATSPLATVDDMKGRLGASVRGGAVYGLLEKAGVEIGDSLRSIGEVRLGADEALASIADSASDQHAFRLSPAALDACFQLAAALGTRSEQWMPSSVGEVVLHRLPAGRLWALAQVSARDEGEAVVSAALLDESGPVLELRNIRQVRPGAPASAADCLYEVTWAPATIDGIADAPVAETRWVLISDSVGFADVLAKKIAAKGGEVVIGSLQDLDAHARREKRETRIVDLSAMGCDDPARLAEALHAVASRLRELEERVHRAWIVTRGGIATSAAEESRIVPAQSAFAAIGRAAASELPDVWGGYIDIDPDAPFEAAAADLLRAIAGQRSGALRSSALMQPRLGRVVMEPGNTAPRFRSDASYLVTGGLGGIGLVVSHWMIDQGARRLVILGRTAVPPRAEWKHADETTSCGRAIASIRALEARGASVHYASVDASDERALRAFAAGFAAEEWPAIRGVIHVAGVVEDWLLRDAPPSSFTHVLAPKVDAVGNLDAVFRDVDHFILFSSITAIVPQAGGGVYAAANAFLDAFAQRRTARGAPTLSIGWGPWGGIGFAARSGGASNVEAMAETGITPLSADDAVSALALLHGRRNGHVIAAAIEWSTFRESIAGRELPLASEQRQDGNATIADTPHAATPTAAPDMNDVVRDALGRVLRTAPSRIDPRKPFGSMGLTSIMAVELRNILERAVGRRLSATLAWNYPTVTALVSYLTDGGAGTVAKDARVSAGAPAAPDVLAVQDMADEDAARLLRRKR